MIRRSRRPPAVTVLALASMLLVTGCMSQPSERRVVQDQIDSVDLPAAQRDCMLEKLEGYTNGELSALARANEDLDFGGRDSIDDATEELQAFSDDFAECLDPDREATEATDAADPSDSTEG